MTDSAGRVILFPHTRWDREGAEPHHRLRVRLADRLAEVLDVLEGEAGLGHFFLDGQAVLIEDHLEIRPEDGERIRRLAASGALALGPWYVLPEPSLVSGEALVRNLRIGRRVAGRTERVGFLPGASRFPAQLPQILARAGIDTFFADTGEVGGTARHWVAPDGSRVRLVPFPQGVAEPEAIVERVRELQERAGEGDVLPVPVGGERAFPPPGLPRILADLEGAFPGVEFVEGGPGEFLVSTGEEDGGRTVAGDIEAGRPFTGILTTRIHLKQANDVCQAMLLGVLEPVLAAARFLDGRDHPSGALQSAWKLLLLNHARVSISGTGADTIHREMETRFAGVAQAAEELLHRELRSLVKRHTRNAGGETDPAITVVNPLPARRDAVVERLVVLPPLDVEFDEWGLYDERGRLVPFEISEVHYVEPFRGIEFREQTSFARQRETFRIYMENFPERMHQSVHRKDRTDCCFTLRFLAEDLPGVGHANFFLRRLEEEPDGPPSPGGVLVAGDTIGNDHLTAHLHPDGTFDLFDKRTGEEYLGLNLLLDTEDVGDAFDTAAAEASETITSRGADGVISTGVPGGLAGSLTAEFVLRLPEAAEPGRRRRSRRIVPCPVRVTLSLDRLSRVLDVEVALANRAEDHLLRAVFPTGIQSLTILTDGPFFVAARPIATSDTPQRFPQQEFSLVQRPGRGLALLTRGLPEVAATADAAGEVTLELSLLRAVGWLSRDDFAERQCTNAGPTISTPDAQCRGMHRFRYAVAPFAGDWMAAGIAALSRAWRVPVPTLQGVSEEAVPGGRGLLEWGDPRVRIEAIEYHEDRDTLSVRLVNLCAEPVEGVLGTGPAIEAVWRTDLRGARGEEFEPKDEHALPVTLGPYEIATVEVAFRT